GDAGFADKYNNNARPYLSSLAEMGEGISAKDYGKGLEGFAAILTKIDPQCTAIAYFQRFGSFMVNILTAKTPDAVSGALEELVPKNQYQVKNIKTFTVSVAALPGIIGGREWISQY